MATYNKLYFSEEQSLKYLPEVEVDTVSKLSKMIMNETLAVFTTFFEILQGETIREKNSLSGRNPPGRAPSNDSF